LEARLSMMLQSGFLLFNGERRDLEVLKADKLLNQIVFQ
jgi:hypothetical protein